MERETALNLLNKKLKNKNLIKHSLAVEAVMGALAEHFNASSEDVERWKTAGLLHDLDYGKTLKNPKKHGLVTAEWLQNEDLDDEIIDAVKVHPGTGERTTRMASALHAADPLTGLIVAAALMHPSKKLSGLDPDFVLRRFNEKRFAAGADRNQISCCSELDMSLEEFVDIALKAMQDVSDDLGL